MNIKIVKQIVKLAYLKEKSLKCYLLHLNSGI